MVAGSATKTSFLSVSSADPATIRICIKVSSQAHKCGLRWLAHYVPLSANPGKERLHGRIDGDRFNTWGYNLLGQNRPKDAHAVFKLAVWAHPTSANAQDSLADGYLAVGGKESAGKAVMRAIELAPGDPLLDAGSKSSFLSEEHARLFASADGATIVLSTLRDESIGF